MLIKYLLKFISKGSYRCRLVVQRDISMMRFNHISIVVLSAHTRLSDDAMLFFQVKKLFFLLQTVLALPKQCSLNGSYQTKRCISTVSLLFTVSKPLRVGFRSERVVAKIERV
jgi:hypothetical protein